jgi:AraC-like DNA-binding protein
MPSSAVQNFTDPDVFASSVRAARAELTFIGRGQFAATLTQVTFSDLWMQRFSDNLSRVMHSAIVTGRAIISFGTQPGPSLFLGGVEMTPTSLVRLSEGQTFFHRSSGPSSFASMSLPIDKIASLGEAMAGCDLTPRREALVVRPTPAAMERLQRLHAVTANLAKEGPEVIANPEAARGLEETLIQAMVACLSQSDSQPRRSARHRHIAIMRRFREVIERNTGEALYLSALCRAVGASARTLQDCCHEHLGMSPIRFLWLRRMHLARTALVMADPATATVTSIAGTYGFWELGRFAVAYRELYGESPRATLRRH